MEQSTTDAADAYFEPLGIKATFVRTVDVFRQRWKHLLAVSSIPVFVWYVAAIGIRIAFRDLSASYTEYKSFEMGDETFTYKWETLHATFSRLGLITEFALFFFLHLPADAACIRAVAGVYAGGDAEGIKEGVRAILPKIPVLGTVCAAWCAALMLPLVLIVLCMAPEDEAVVDGLSVYYQPWLPKLVAGIAYLVASSAFMLATYFSYSIVILKGRSPIASMKESLELFNKNWSHVGAVALLWFLIKVAITKFVSVINWRYYLHERRFWVVWDQPGIPLHPVRVLWSTSNDLWEFGRSWISVPFVVFLAAAGSVLQAVLYVDARVKGEGYNQSLLRGELGLDGGDEETEMSDYKTLGGDVPAGGGDPAPGPDGGEAADYKKLEDGVPASGGTTA